MDLNVRYYTAKYNASNSTFTWRELEYVSNGDRVKYRRFTGLEDKGKIKNIYTETYADSDIIRVDISDTIAREATTMTLDMVIIRNSQNREQTLTFDNLYYYFADGITVYWDTQRQRCAIMVLLDKSEVKEDTYLGTPYIECEFKFQNICGDCPIINDTFSSSHLPLVEAYALQQILTATT